MLRAPAAESRRREIAAHLANGRKPAHIAALLRDEATTSPSEFSE